MRVTLFHFRNIWLTLSFDQFPKSVSAFERGSADRYYGRKFRPNLIDFWGRERTNLTQNEIAEYTEGWDTEEDRKEWSA